MRSFFALVSQHKEYALYLNMNLTSRRDFYFGMIDKYFEIG